MLSGCVGAVQCSQEERFKVVAGIGKTVLMTFHVSMSKMGSYQSVNSKGGNRCDIYT